jgi:phosphatidylglycerophosphatase A
MFNRQIRSITTLGIVGYMPMPGTCATLITVPCAYLLLHMLGQCWYTALVAMGTFIALCLIQYILSTFDQVDPHVIVLDEVIGTALVVLFCSSSWPMLVIAILLFRLFDITKWCGIKYFERIPGALGVVADDCAAALLAVLGTTLVTWFS